jgi:broad specificity phosphatase PhoE
VSVLLLIRHGQASFGKRDYDALSDRGHEQSRVLGAALAARGAQPSLIVSGGQQRHGQTVEGVLSALVDAGVTEPAVTVDDGWNEFDFDHVMQVHKPAYRSKALMYADFARTPRAERSAKFQAMFEEATARWTAGTADDDYDEPFPAFGQRVDAALKRATGLADGTVLVVSSGGPIALAVSHLLTGDASLWGQLNRVAVNAAVTKVLAGRTGLNLSTYNEHSHLEPSLVTYR